MSEVAKVREHLEQAYIAGVSGLFGYAVVANHTTISHQYSSLQPVMDGLRSVMGEQDAAIFMIKVLDTIPSSPSQHSKDHHNPLQQDQSDLSHISILS